ncbi:MAG: hypothetical protein WA421_12345, partial [Nitrososphaeraceae archaeon]
FRQNEQKEIASFPHYLNSFPTQVGIETTLESQQGLTKKTTHLLLQYWKIRLNNIESKTGESCAGRTGRFWLTSYMTT